MPNTAKESDADFYSLIHQVLRSGEKSKTSERRKHQREPFPTIQRVAARREPDGEIPNESEFIDVVCHDLTRGGFSFFMPDRPDFDSLVAAFSGGMGVIYVFAEIVHCDGVLVYPSGMAQRIAGWPIEIDDLDPIGRNAKPMTLVRCRFTERLHA